MVLAFGILGVTAAGQTLVFALSGSVALLADLIHYVGDAATAIPLGIAICAVILRITWRSWRTIHGHRPA